MAYTQASLILNSPLAHLNILIFVRNIIQVVLLVYMTLVVCLLIGSQYIQPLSKSRCHAIWNNETVVEEEKDAYAKDRFEHNAFILFNLAQFLFYLGWLTVAKIMLNPFGEDPGELFLPAIQPADIGWPTGNGKKLSNCQACCLAQLCLAAAYFLSISCGPSWARALYSLG